VNPNYFPEKCFVCGGNQFFYQTILWKELVDEWELSEFEIDYINRQQGLSCKSCQSNLRSIVLAKAFLVAVNNGKTLEKYTRTFQARKLRVLEVNEAGSLHRTLLRFRNYTFAEYPEVDLHDLPYKDESFDFVIHSDTLEHVEQPLVALSEIHRVLKRGGRTIFTTPIIVDRLSRNRTGLPKSYHGSSKVIDEGMLVTHEYGSDFWKFLAESGFADIRIVTESYPAGISFICTK
jgi:SAM-dependent methyltransferase